MLGALSLKQGTQASMCNCGQQKWRKPFWTPGTSGNATNKSMVDTEYLCDSKVQGGYPKFLNKLLCSVGETSAGPLWWWCFYSDFLQHHLPSHATQKAGHTVVLLPSQFSQLQGGSNPLRLATAKSKQSLCCKLVPQELSTSLEGRFEQDDLQKFLPTSSPFWPLLGQQMPHFCDKDSNHGPVQHPIHLGQSDYHVKGRR